jgi:hypothetical protein
MALSRREFQLLMERVSKLENQFRMLEDKMKVHDSRMKGENLMRILKEAEGEEKARKERDSAIGP